jgi:DNA polymerase
MLVGEQPGHEEDLQGLPFVGPAGKVLDDALREAGVDRETCFVTNAVKHFEHEPRGKRRIHKKPSASEIDICRWWLDLETRLVRPDLIVALGATAARGVLGRSITISRTRGHILTSQRPERVLVTVHPSYLLRIEDRSRKGSEWRQFVADLRTAKDWLDRTA